MKNKVLIFVFALIFVSFAFVSATQFPKPYDLYVNDYASVFNQQETYYLQSLFADVEQNTTAQVVVVTIDSLNGSDMNQYATQLGDSWGVGQSDKDNGLVILYSKQENKIYAATGYGLEGVLPASLIGRLLDENYVPLKNEGNVSSGIISFCNAIYPILIQNADYIKSSKSSSRSISLFGGIIFFLIVFFIIALIAYPFVSRKQKGFSDFMMFFFIDFLVRIIVYAIIFGGRGSGRGSGGFGGGGFGGGSFGGGGAGR